MDDTGRLPVSFLSSISADKLPAYHGPDSDVEVTLKWGANVKTRVDVNLIGGPPQAQQTVNANNATLILEAEDLEACVYTIEVAIDEPE